MISCYKLDVKATPTGELVELMDRDFFGKFADFLMVSQKISKLNTTLGYISSLKCMMQDDYPTAVFFQGNSERWYTAFGRIYSVGK
jgi:hypothetical protein